MKITTDACIFGAWCANTSASNVLDIGAGTGLLALMYAQKNKSVIKAIELDKNSSVQCNENFSKSKWSNALLAINDDFINWSKAEKTRFDLIISNPPFFNNQFLSNNDSVNKSRHTITLSFEDLIAGVKILLKEDGKFFVLLACNSDQLFEIIALRYGLFLNQKLLIRENGSKPFIRAICEFSYRKTKTEVKEFTIRNADGHYSKMFCNLLSNYYLKL